jgi:hypothetical protein
VWTRRWQEGMDFQPALWAVRKRMGLAFKQ